MKGDDFFIAKIVVELEVLVFEPTPEDADKTIRAIGCLMEGHNGVSIRSFSYDLSLASTEDTDKADMS